MGKILLLFLTVISAAGCSISKPCSEAGDTSWPTKILGDRKCSQRKLKDGKWVNDGNYRQFYPNGTLAVEGEFVNGKKQGIWTQYDESGAKTVEKYFDEGVEKMISTPAVRKSK